MVSPWHKYKDINNNNNNHILHMHLLYPSKDQIKSVKPPIDPTT